MARAEITMRWRANIYTCVKDAGNLFLFITIKICIFYKKSLSRGKIIFSYGLDT